MPPSRLVLWHAGTQTTTPGSRPQVDSLTHSVNYLEPDDVKAHLMILGCFWARRRPRRNGISIRPSPGVSIRVMPEVRNTGDE